MTSRPLRRIGVAAAAAGLALALPFGIGPRSFGPVAHAAIVSFDVIGAADGMRTQVYVPDAPLSSQVVDAGAPTAQTEVNELGTSTGFASNPYPGATILSGPGLVAGETNLNLPGYPLVAQSSAPSTPSASAEGGLLKAASTATMSSASAVAGAPTAVNGVGDLTATALSQIDSDGGVTAQAAGEAQDIALAGVLHIGAVKSTATLEVGPDGTSHPSTQTVVSDATIAGVAVTIDSHGITLAGTDHALPDTSSVTAPLASAGLTVTVTRPTITPTQVLSGALVITESKSGDTYTYTFGRAVAAVQTASGPGPATPPGSLTGVGPSPSTSTPTVGTSPASANSPISSGSTGTSSGVAMSAPSPSFPAKGAGNAPTGGTGSPGAVTGPAPVSNGGENLVAFASQDGIGFFAIIILAALVILGGSFLVRIYAVRRPWTS
ncbi:MAG TPA: hypothetical protein VKI19_03220 [Acidimicrobiales bacterium]|nr:hypothetical protein [Acidimicrobiales bacterium]